MAVAGLYHCTACSLGGGTVPSHESRQITTPQNEDSQPHNSQPHNNPPRASVQGYDTFYVFAVI